MNNNDIDNSNNSHIDNNIHNNSNRHNHVGLMLSHLGAKLGHFGLQVGGYGGHVGSSWGVWGLLGPRWPPQANMTPTSPQKYHMLGAQNGAKIDQKSIKMFIKI